jgi:hypothetical protein
VEKYHWKLNQKPFKFFLPPILFYPVFLSHLYICPSCGNMYMLRHSLTVNAVKTMRITMSSARAYHTHSLLDNTWSDNKVRKLITVKVLHTSLLNITVVNFKVLPLGSYAPMPVSSQSSKQFWNWFCGMAFRAAVILLLMSSMSSKFVPFNISFIFRNRKK